jgi:hypothetical protein
VVRAITRLRHSTSRLSNADSGQLRSNSINNYLACISGNISGTVRWLAFT